MGTSRVTGISRMAVLALAAAFIAGCSGTDSQFVEDFSANERYGRMVTAQQDANQAIMMRMQGTDNASALGFGR